MPAYWVARAKVNDPVEYKRYTDLVPAIIQKFGGKVLARGGRFESLEEPQKFDRHIVISSSSLRPLKRPLPAMNLRNIRKPVSSD